MQPEVLVLLLADRAHFDDVSGKAHISGTRPNIGAASFPHTHALLVVYAVFVDGRGEVNLRFRLIDVNEDREPAGEEEVTVLFPSPLDEVELVVAMTDVSFPEPGNYRLQVIVDGVVLRERSLDLIPLENPN